MMNKTNYQRNQFFENTQLRCLSIRACSTHDRELQGEVSRMQLPGGSIDYAYYDKEARAIRSGAFHGRLTALLKTIRGIWG